MNLHVGIDIGSTTAKLVVMDGDQLLYKVYERHFSQVRQKTVELLENAAELLAGASFTAAISGSAGFGMASAAGIEFVQEVFATGEAVKQYYPGTDVVIELGGEDAKIIFLTGGLEERMNGTCAGGTGAFIDQMASLLNVTTGELDALSLRHEKIYPIASRCGVFAKSDIQPLLNQGARKEDIAASIFQAVVNQTITGLAQGRQIEGKVLFLGGPLYFFKGLQERFVETLSLDGDRAVFPQLGQYAVAMGAALYASRNAQPIAYEDLLQNLRSHVGDTGDSHFLPPLFENDEDYQVFVRRHGKNAVEQVPMEQYRGNAYLGIDCGSTTTKLVLIGEDAQILYQYYSSNQGNPLDLVREQLIRIRTLCGGDVHIRMGAATGYGEDLIKSAFSIDEGIVETMAHFKAAQFFNPKVDFIMDIGGQDIKCFKIKNGAVDSIMLNEACSSGCGSFIETFAKSMGCTVSEFAQKGLFSRRPVDLGSRCTVFMNSKVKQAQKDGASVEDISAGLSVSVVKNAIYKVIRAHSAADLGEHIVVQGGTFLNDAVLRSFEKELGHDVIRPNIAGIMGAFGAALFARERKMETSALLGLEELRNFTHESKPAVCRLCANQCSLTVNFFSGSKKFISGNRCERPLGKKGGASAPDLMAYKLDRICALKPVQGKRGKIGIPLGLNMFENIPFWHAFLTNLGFEVVMSDISSQKLFSSGRYSIPSDTACYPAKLMHGHIENLLEKGIKTIFYPCMSYNFNEKKGDNFYNCPVVAYYPELLRANILKLEHTDFLYPYFGVHRRRDFEKHALDFFSRQFPGVTKKEIQAASEAGYRLYEQWHQDMIAEGRKALDYAAQHHTKAIVLAGRPYHVDPEVNHGIDKLITSFGIPVLTEDCVSDLVEPQKVNVLNQWTYHARLYNAAKYVTTQENLELVQLVSFGCGIDAITTDEVMSILEKGGKLYTQIKIDEINNLGAVKIRIRSLLGALEERERKQKAVPQTAAEDVVVSAGQPAYTLGG